jgi:hypothetical protein
MLHLLQTEHAINSLNSSAALPHLTKLPHFLQFAVRLCQYLDFIVWNDRATYGLEKNLEGSSYGLTRD